MSACVGPWERLSSLPVAYATGKGDFGPPGLNRATSKEASESGWNEMTSTMKNPYRSPTDHLTVSPVRGSFRGIWFSIWLFFYLYAVWAAGSFYGVWLVAWATLGYPPQPSLDDPKFIRGLVDYVYVIPGFLLIGLPPSLLFGFVASCSCPIRVQRASRVAQSTVLALVYVFLWVAAFVVVRADPFRVIEWWVD